MNGQKIAVPSYQVRKGDVIQVREKSWTNEQIRHAVEATDSLNVPSWLELQADQFRGIVTDIPKREDLDLPTQGDLGKEAWSK